MGASSRPLTRDDPPDHDDSTWQLVDVAYGETRKKQNTTVAQPSVARHRRGRTEGSKHLSMFKVRSKSNTIPSVSIDHHISPSASIASSNAGHEVDASRPQSVWSESDHSDSQTKSWVAKGSKMLRKQNSRFNLSSSRTIDWLEEDDETAGKIANPMLEARISTAGCGQSVTASHIHYLRTATEGLIY